MKLSCIIIEDEPLARERAREYIDRIPSLRLAGEFEDAMDGLAFLKENTVDLIFLDINLGRVSGIELLEFSKLDSAVIITTAYHEFAVKGYELNVTDYLLKPYTFERFAQAVSKVEAARNRKTPEYKHFIFVKTENRLEKINYSEILYIEGMRDYRRIHTTTRKVMTLQNFSDLEREIPQHIVCRVHKSYMVAIDKIERVERDGIKVGGVYVPLSEGYRKGFMDRIRGV